VTEPDRPLTVKSRYDSVAGSLPSSARSWVSEPRLELGAASSTRASADGVKALVALVVPLPPPLPPPVPPPEHAPVEPLVLDSLEYEPGASAHTEREYDLPHSSPVKVYEVLLVMLTRRPSRARR